MLKAYYWKYILIRHFCQVYKKVCFKGFRWKLNKIQCFLIIIYNKTPPLIILYQCSWSIGYKGKTNSWPIFWTIVLLTINVNRFPSPINEQWLEHHEKLFKWTQKNWTLFIFLQGSTNITRSQLRVRNCLCKKVSAINIGYFNTERDFVSLGNTEILLWPWESEQRKNLNNQL